MRPMTEGSGVGMSEWPESPAPDRRFVLPRFLRRPARMILKRADKLPKHLGTKALFAFFGVTAIAGVVIGGHVTTVFSATTAWAGLAIDQVTITGQSETSEVDILEGLGIDPYASLVVFDTEQGQARLEAMPWIESAAVRKLYPDTLQVEVVEREPYAVWQLGGKVMLIDENGKVIAEQIAGRYTHLPLVVGPSAQERADEFVTLLGEFPGLAPRVKAGVLISGRRWNVVLKNGVEIMLPKDDPAGALIQAVALDDGHGIFSREIAVVDLRLANRLVFRLTEEGFEAREELLKKKRKTGPRV